MGLTLSALEGAAPVIRREDGQLSLL